MIVNGNEVDLQAGTTLKAYLEGNGYDPRTVAIEKNGFIIPRDSFASETLFGDDKMEIVTFAGGG
jgi:thiamine biosynthesis protein ThiS